MDDAGAHRPISIITTKGVLPDLYSVCHVAFIGSTLWDSYRGSQNLLEPAFYGKRLVAGTKVFDNTLAFAGLEKSKLLVRVKTQRQLNTNIYKGLTLDPHPREIQRAHEFISSMQGTADKYASKIHKMLYS